MPQALLDKLPSEAKKIYESTYADVLDKTKDEEKAAIAAISAVKNAGFKKGETGWMKASEQSFVYVPIFLLGEDLKGWVEVGATGIYTDMNGHSVSISDVDLNRYIQGFEENVRGQDLPITFDHPKSGGAAAGWFRGLRKTQRHVRGEDRDVLLMKPEWTPKGHSAVKNKEYQYLSLEIMPNGYLRGASLVNYPAVKGLLPVGQTLYFSEIQLEEKMPDDVATKTVKCPACGADVPSDSATCPACGAKMKSEEKPVPEKENKQLSEMMERIAQLEKETGVVVALQEENVSLKKTNVQLSEEVERQGGQINTLIDLNNMLRLHEKAIVFMGLNENESKTIAPAYEEEIINLLLLAQDQDQEAKILAFLGKLALGEAVVEMGERGNGSIPGSPERSQKGDWSSLHEKALKMAKDGDIEYREALMALSQEVGK